MILLKEVESKDETNRLKFLFKLFKQAGLAIGSNQSQHFNVLKIIKASPMLGKIHCHDK